MVAVTVGSAASFQNPRPAPRFVPTLVLVGGFGSLPVPRYSSPEKAGLHKSKNFGGRCHPCPTAGATWSVCSCWFFSCSPTTRLPWSMNVSMIHCRRLEYHPCQRLSCTSTCFQEGKGENATGAIGTGIASRAMRWCHWCGLGCGCGGMVRPAPRLAGQRPKSWSYFKLNYVLCCAWDTIGKGAVLLLA